MLDVLSGGPRLDKRWFWNGHLNPNYLKSSITPRKPAIDMQTLANLDWQKKKDRKHCSHLISYIPLSSQPSIFMIFQPPPFHIFPKSLVALQKFHFRIRRKYILFKLYQAHSLQKSKKRSLGYFVVAVGDVRIS